MYNDWVVKKKKKNEIGKNVYTHKGHIKNNRSRRMRLYIIYYYVILCTRGCPLDVYVETKNIKWNTYIIYSNT